MFESSYRLASVAQLCFTVQSTSRHISFMSEMTATLMIFANGTESNL